MFSQIMEGHVDLADFMFFLAVVAFCIALLTYLVAAMANPKIERVAVTAGLAFLAFGFFAS
jgi:hypothetical protein